jgi:ribosomal protein L40E
MAAADQRLGLGRLCPRCGARSDTLGTVCPRCGKPYAPGGRLRGARLLVFAWVALVAVAAVVLVRHPVAGILLGAAAFGLLVAGIGISNVLTDRGR